MKRGIEEKEAEKKLIKLIMKEMDECESYGKQLMKNKNGYTALEMLIKRFEFNEGEEMAQMGVQNRHGWYLHRIYPLMEELQKMNYYGSTKKDLFNNFFFLEK